MLPQDCPAGKDSKYRFKAHQKGCNSWLHMLLPYYLESVGKATGEDSCIEYREGTGQDIFDMRCLEESHAYHSHCPGYKELETGKFDSVGAGCKIAYG